MTNDQNIAYYYCVFTTYITCKKHSFSLPTLQSFDNIPPRSTRPECLPLVGIRLHCPPWPFAPTLRCAPFLQKRYRRSSTMSLRLEPSLVMRLDAFLLLSESGMKQEQEESLLHQRTTACSQSDFSSCVQAGQILRRYLVFEIQENNYTGFYC